MKSGESSFLFGLSSTQAPLLNSDDFFRHGPGSEHLWATLSITGEGQHHLLLADSFLSSLLAQFIRLSPVKNPEASLSMSTTLTHVCPFMSALLWHHRTFPASQDPLPTWPSCLPTKPPPWALAHSPFASNSLTPLLGFCSGRAPL